MSSLLTVMTDYVSSIARSDATPTRRGKMKRSVATINQMKESVALKNRRQIDAESTPNQCYGIIANRKSTSKSAPNRRNPNIANTLLSTEIIFRRSAFIHDLLHFTAFHHPKADFYFSNKSLYEQIISV